MKPTLPLLFVVITLTMGACGWEDSVEPTIDVVAALSAGATPDTGYARATAIREFRFPADHGAHPDFRNEWWYLTGHLQDDQGNRYGYQATFFRIAVTPTPPESASAWAANQLWMAHAAVTDVSADRHREMERFARGALGLAGATTETVNDDPANTEVWLGDWRLSGVGRERWQLSLNGGEFAVNLGLNPIRPVVLQGERGLSQKSPEPGNASYYYSIPRLSTRGTVTTGGRTVTVTGLSWFDREWSTSALAADQSGWDWFSLQLDNGEDLMFYRLRDRNGDLHPNSLGTRITPDRTSAVIRPGQIRLQPLDWWRSPTGRRYPVRWRLQHDGDDWQIQAVLPDQEMNLSAVYWEGLVAISDWRTGDVVGHGYLEMTGY